MFGLYILEVGIIWEGGGGCKINYIFMKDFDFIKCKYSGMLDSVLNLNIILIVKVCFW